ncbi:MAG: TAT-variant-translocated molybdopterin oxidoreductase [Lacipirellulaceae bacterium]
MNLPIVEAPRRTPAPKLAVGQYWRSIQELEHTDAFQEFLHREFPQAASEFPEGVSRRRWMQLMGASFALATAAGCRWETEKIVAYADSPEGYVPGKPEHFATNFAWAGGPKHVLVTKYDGRPVKVEGNPEHPASRGGTDTFTQAATLALYDPDRATQVRLREKGKTFGKEWSDFEAYLAERVAALGDGASLAVLTQPLASYAMFDALDRVAEKFPAAKFYAYAPLSRENELAGAELAFGKRLRTHYRLPGASVIAAFDADVLTMAPDALRAARDYGDRRDPDGVMNRLYAVESQFSTTGAAADHRLPLKSAAIGAFLGKLRDKVKELLTSDAHDHGDPIEGQPTPDEFLEVLADDLSHNEGESVVIVGAGQPAAVHALAHEINSLLGNFGKTVLLTDEPAAKVAMVTLAELQAAAAAGSVDTLLIIDGNPAYDAPGDVNFAEGLAKVPNTIRLGYYDDETSRLCRWSLPLTHPFEEWGDVIGWDGTIGVCQPMIEPLVGGRSALAVLSMLGGDASPDTRQLVATAVAERTDATDDNAWNKLLHDGYFGGTAFAPIEAKLKGGNFPAPAAPADDELELVLTASSSTYDGRFANSGWLQETPDFLTKLTWDNAALVSDATAKKLGLKHGVMAELKVGDTKVKAPVYVMPGQAAGSIGLALGYGRVAAGHVGGLIDEQGVTAPGPFANSPMGLWMKAPAASVGVSAFPLLTSAGAMFFAAVTTKSTGEAYLLATTQDHHAIDRGGLEAIGKRTGELIRTASKDFYDEHNDFAPNQAHDVMVHAGGEHRPTEPLWTLRSYDGGHAWGMAIDLSKCIGCNACMVACQAENNVPVVGKDQVARGREMHWIRIDRYFKGTANPADASDPENFVNPEVAHQPIACQQCETAPCEEVCPVAATLHDDEGLNNMVYNRCVGTRYCANNCPYKVRRFNFFRYSKSLYEASNELMKLVSNPEVTVRSRGVMEKCTYCQQRISAGRIAAKIKGEAIQDGAIMSACQQACPTRAIEFGDLKQEGSRVAAAHAKPRAYGILTELMTKPRTVFLAKVRNPHERLVKTTDNPVLHHHSDEGHGDHDADHGHDHSDEKKAVKAEA